MHSLRSLAAAAALCAASAAATADVAYISSSSGFMLNMSGNTAVTARWQGQSAIQGFSGYGRIQVNGRCLTGRGGAGQPLTWEGCNNDKTQRWSLSGNGRLNNEAGWCADVKGGSTSAGAQVIAWNCTGAVNQQWHALVVQSASSIASRIGSASVRSQFMKTVNSVPAGTVINTQTGLPGAGVIAVGGANVIAAGGANVIAAGGAN